MSLKAEEVEDIEQDEEEEDCAGTIEDYRTENSRSGSPDSKYLYLSDCHKFVWSIHEQFGASCSWKIQNPL